ncbi:DUF1772 domain-containing protein [Actinomycetospora endophytica]|uniref:DUF1772 domain-containing protein n=1 Tax=Actinomycetospora endophytica TaxID=2291215 RepID=A0ABS8PCP0_9PSEU|nr:anthrone oxygenase family protein [Actinomycetospora endophytica]MCD2195667.1 DUF1772 domain-containing protein [Actinomycetospora endophytica]
MTILMVAAPTAGAALAGVYLAFDLAVLPALRRVRVPVGAGDRSSDEVAADVMRRINVAIVRPSFLALLFGAPALAVAAGVTNPGPFTVAAAIAQVAGLVVTLAVNVPRNEALARDEDPGAWARFVGPWTRAHRVRSAAALLGAVVGVVGLGLQ